MKQLSLLLPCQGDSPDRRAAAAFSDPAHLAGCELEWHKLTSLLLAWKNAAGKAILRFSFQPHR